MTTNPPPLQGGDRGDFLRRTAEKSSLAPLARVDFISLRAFRALRGKIVF
jgi:hypothetical protein